MKSKNKMRMHVGSDALHQLSGCTAPAGGVHRTLC